MRIQSSFLASLFALAACSGDPPPPKQEAPQPAKTKANVVRVTTPAPYGAKIACTDLFDPTVASTTIGDMVEIRDRSAGEADATSICAFMKSGAPPSTTDQLKKFEKENMVLGVLPGDEYCMVAAYCGFVVTEDDVKKACTGEGDRGDAASVGVFACVHETQRATKYAYKYTVLDPDSRCRLEVQGGPSVTDEPLVQRCTRLGLDSINGENVKKFKM